ncbi:MAG: signal recognition particle-docking protein FtsY [Candidatus Bathyarchaeota archaeon]
MLDRLKGAFNSFVDKVSTAELTDKSLDAHLEDFRIALLENDVAIFVVDRICDELKKKIREMKVGRFQDKKALLMDILHDTLIDTLSTGGQVDILKLTEEKRNQGSPLIIAFVGINGTGKTTTVGKVAKFLMDHGLSTVLACSDTYRAGAIEQLEIHAKNLGVKIIRHEYGSDAASVAFDAIAYAKAKGIRTVLIDTAGRMETNRNLMEEMRKIIKVTKPDLVVFVGDALTGNDAVIQAEEFNKFVPISASILTKMDADAKGGAAISISHVTKSPIIFIGVGQTYEDLTPFNPEDFVNLLMEKW